jgi:hypothetical protein
LFNFGLQILHGLEAKTSFCNAHGQIHVVVELVNSDFTSSKTRYLD